MNEILRIKSISQFHEILSLPLPDHPLISLIDENTRKNKPDLDKSLYNIRFCTDMYAIMYKDKISGSIGYGRSTYDFQAGTLIFASPGQVFTTPDKSELKGKEGWTLLFHPDLIRKSALGSMIDDYNFFSYDVNEALHLSPKEEKFFFDLILKIREEYSQNMDQHSQTLIISNLELLLNYCKRFYDRQFFTRTNISKDFVATFESALKDYFNSEISLNGLPSTNYFGEQLNMSTHYLSDMLKKETGKGIKDHINDMLVQKAKQLLLSKEISISEVAYSLGFEYPQSFSRVFKNKTGISPKAYRNTN